MKETVDWSVYLVTADNLSSPGALEEVVREAVRGGVGLVQLREKNSATRDFVARAVRLRKILQPLNIPLLINDRIDVALAAGAAGVHLGQDDMPVGLARRILGKEAIIGLSLENISQLSEAELLAVDYYGVSPIFPTPTKTDTRGAWGLEGLAQLRSKTGRPLIAIGGINLANVQQIIEAGADGVAVVSAICSAANPFAAAGELLRKIKETRKATVPSSA